MFGLESHSESKNKKTFVFELEKEFKDPDLQKKIRERILDQLQLIKKQLHEGKEQDAFNVLGTVLHGYIAVLKVLDRSVEKK
jgi:D-hexose-6-phosphate mutarotase